MKNIGFHYLYRDGSNFKKWHCAIFSNPENLSLADIAEEIRKLLPDDLFIADQVRLPELFLYNDEPLNPDDHCFHEFSFVEYTEKKMNDPYERTVADFLSELSSAELGGWRVFDPWERSYERQLERIDETY